ncbi:MAG: SdrD B-like domain-containing protein [Caldilineales bacterium]
MTPSVEATAAPTATVAPEETPAAPAGAGSIQGVVYFDRNQDGARDGTVEPGIADVVVTLYTQNRAEVARATTNFRGQFEFSGLAPGIYVVVESDPAGFLSSTPNNYTVRILGAIPNPEVSFGDYR